MNNTVLPFAGATYIKAEKGPRPFSFQDPAPLFRRKFSLSALPKEAKLYFQCKGFADLYLNGKPVTDEVLHSPTSDYSRILWYQVYEVSHLLQAGENTLCLVLGNGFFNETFDTPWHHNHAPWRDAPQFILRLLGEGEELLVSDSAFRVSLDRSPIVFNQLRSGEYYDARKKDDTWLWPEFDDGDWSPAIECPPTSAEFHPTPCPPIRELERISPVAITETARGYLVDFGVTLSGYGEFTLKEKRGQEILFYYCEDITPEGDPKHNKMNEGQFAYVAPFHLNKLIASGEWDTFKPRFSYHGFRYVLITGLSEPPKKENATAIFLHQDIARRSEFSCGNPILQYIYDCGIRSTYSNMHWCLTDCPTREKLGWANDAQASVEQTLLNFDILSLYRKWFEEIKAAMREDGALPGIIPSPGWGFDCGPICDCLLYEIPYRCYLYAGDAGLLKEGIPYFQRYIPYLKSKIPHPESFWLGDWMGHGNAPKIPMDFVWRFYLLKALRITALAKGLAGEDAAPWQEEYEKERTAFLKDYLTPGGECTIAEQSSIAMLLSEEVGENTPILRQQLTRVLERDGISLTCGMVGVQYLYDALALCGRPDLAIKLMTESDPGYKTWYEAGASTLWESWDGRDIGSKNHHMFSGVIAWFYKALLGITPRKDAPGFKEITLSPHFVSGLGFAKGSVETARGRILAGWEEQEEGFLYTVSIPEGIRADYNGKALSAGESIFWIPKE